MEANKFIFIILINLVIILSLGITNGYEDIHESRVVWGNVNQTRRFHTQIFRNYPPPGNLATGSGSHSSSNTIRGMRLTRLNNTDGLWTHTGGGLNHNFVSFNFSGSGLGRAYDFELELFGTAASKSLSIILVALSSFTMFIKYFMY
ncbi:unnamed protein product [Chironomus riparius]|uniref:Uncharacterized protein n=1 Tax=Chironomus riparius TaxID=315576 RepID=A0A9N9RIP4_9DIPT|nr:unnamed protein product [Chironomus riparius]